MPLSNYKKTTVGSAFTVRYVPASDPPGSVGDFIDDVAVGDVIVIDNEGRSMLVCEAFRARSLAASVETSIALRLMGRWMRQAKIGKMGKLMDALWLQFESKKSSACLNSTVPAADLHEELRLYSGRQGEGNAS